MALPSLLTLFHSLDGWTVSMPLAADFKARVSLRKKSWRDQLLMGTRGPGIINFYVFRPPQISCG